MRRPMRRLACLLLSSLALAGCATAPPYAVPDADVPTVLKSVCDRIQPML